MFLRRLSPLLLRPSTTTTAFRPFTTTTLLRQNVPNDVKPEASDPPCPCSVKDLDIDRTTPLTNSRPRYGVHLLVHKGTPAQSWPSRVEDEPEDINKSLKLKSVNWPMIPKTGPASVTAVETPPVDGFKTTITHLPALKEFSFPEDMPLEEIAFFLSTGGDVGQIPAGAKATDITGPLVIVCGHGARDNRCGVLGPIIAKEAEQALGTEGKVMLSAHIGGHKWAGNIIIYERNGDVVRGDWYGRVGPGDVVKILEARKNGEIWEKERCYRGGLSWDMKDADLCPAPTFPQ
ncbi:hypothetical protein BJ508DRAFT_357688 [Ascobolus immersus RN42]|uniref:Sucraseferredoxin-like protein n=1 Tax=Ascobolus immersus RN42 TaxID=1160509 RepID=A0A3N4IMA9_ASCIM|nr:hypothetical protein BJ508DRAFT_357688 [Ascobolus immersus RN42]